MDKDKQQYINTLKNLNIRPKKVKIESKEQVLLEKSIETMETLRKNLLNEIFVQSGEIEAIPSGKERDMQILRLGIIAEMDASNLYEKLAGLAKDGKVKKVLLDISREEKVHVGEFEELLESIDPEYEKAEKEGEDEVKNVK